VVEFAGIEPKRSLDIPQCLVQRIAPAKPPMFQMGSKCEVEWVRSDVRFHSDSDRVAGFGEVLKSAKTGSRGAFQLALSGQVIEQCLRLFQIKRVDPFGEPAVDRSKKLASLLPLDLRTPETREAHCGAECHSGSLTARWRLAPRELWLT
jgi:hypothetical protein